MTAALLATNLNPGQKILLETSSLPGGALALEAIDSTQLEGNRTLVSATVGTTLSAAAITSGAISRTGPSANFSDATDTAAAIIAAIGATQVGASFYWNIINGTAFTETITAGSGVTLTGQAILYPNTFAQYLAVVTGVGANAAITMYERGVFYNRNLPQTQFTTLNATVGTLPAGAITGANNVVLQSTNATPGAQTTRTAAQMLADIPNGAVGMSWNVRIINTGAGAFTLTADASVTLTGDAVILQDSWVDYIVTLTGAATATMQSVGNNTEDSLPAAKFTSINATVGTLAAGNITGADRVFLVSTNATPGAQTTRTAAQMFADTPNAKVGQTWTVRIQNTGGGTFTLTADASVTLGGTAHAAILTNTWVDYICTFTSAVAMTMNAVGAGTSP